MGRHSLLQYRDIYIGMLPNNTASKWTPHPTYALPSSTLPVATTDGTFGNQGGVTSFIGQMQSFYINGNYVFETARAGHLNNMEVSLLIYLFIYAL